MSLSVSNSLSTPAPPVQSFSLPSISQPSTFPSPLLLETADSSSSPPSSSGASISSTTSTTSITSTPTFTTDSTSTTSTSTTDSTSLTTSITTITSTSTTDSTSLTTSTTSTFTTDSTSLTTTTTSTPTTDSTSSTSSTPTTDSTSSTISTTDSTSSTTSTTDSTSSTTSTSTTSSSTPTTTSTSSTTTTSTPSTPATSTTNQPTTTSKTPSQTTPSNTPTNSPTATPPHTGPSATDGSSSSPQGAPSDLSPLSTITQTGSIPISITITSGSSEVVITPPLLTLTLTSNGSTLTEVISQSTAAPGTLRDNSDGGSSQFFRNKGAVAGVFLVVGLAAASIVLFIFFWFRRRRNKQRQRDASIAAGLAALGHNRSLIDDDDDNPAPAFPGMVQTRNQESLSLSSRGEDQDFNPYVGHTYGSSRPYAGSLRPGQSYGPSGYQVAPSRDPDATVTQGGHTPEMSFGTVSSNNPGATAPATPSPGINNGHQRTNSFTPLITQVAGLEDSDQPPSPGSHYSEGEGNVGREVLRKKGPPDPRLNAALLSRSDSQGGASLGDHVDYTRPLTVRNE